jgi:hypothetical protein
VAWQRSSEEVLNLMTLNPKIKDIGKVILDIGDGGIVIEAVSGEWGPEIRISSSHYGNNVHTQTIMTTVSAFRELAELFNYAADYQDYSGEYVIAAKPYHPEDFLGSGSQQGGTPETPASCGNTVCCGGNCHG